MASTRTAARAGAEHRGRTRARVIGLCLTLALGLGTLLGQVPETASAATCPCSIFTAGQVPSNPAENDTDAVELGVKFRSDQAGFITGIRFYKGTGNTGTHTGSLWSAAGARLATVTFTAETATGWQQALFASPVAITADTTYVASYYAPVGRYAADGGYFAASGVTGSPLSAPANGVDGGNGVYRYGTGGGFPASSYQATNYWVDVVFDGAAVDTTKPTVVDRSPAAGATGVPTTGTTVSATFSEAVVATSPVLAVTSGGTPVAGSAAYDAATRTITFTPTSAFAVGTIAVALSGARDPAGNTMDPVSWTFTTATGGTGCPCSIWPSTATPATVATADSSAVELGVKFRSTVAGYVTGVRFYKGTGNTGTHTGSLWNSAGTRLATVTFTGETATGWQQATFGAPVPVAANTSYVASYYAPVGRYSSNSGYFAAAATTRGPLTALRNGTDGGNGLYRYGASGLPTSTYQSTNYWVDVVFATTAVDNTAPTVVAKSPAAGSDSAATSTAVTATFSEGVVASSIAFQLTGPGGAVPATVAYDAATQTATLTPSTALAASTSYTASVKNARDAAGNVMADLSWGFATAAPPPPGPEQGPGGPIAVVTSAGNPYSTYLAEMLRTEGLNEFATVDVGSLTASTLAAYDVVILGSTTVTAAQAADLSAWVTGGGNLIAIKPSASLSGLAGLTAASGTTADAYLKVDPTAAGGAGIVTETMQYHGPADRYSLTAGAGTAAVATLYANATTATAFPAVTLRGVGSAGGQVATFTYDLPRSVILTRQGNPAWAGTERDGQNPIRSDDQFFGGAATDWVDLSKVAIPQADEQQRLLANLIQVMNRDRKPLPRFWYFPRSLKAVVVGTGDDHGNGGTAGRFNQYLANSPPGCSVAEWTCPRFSSYVYPSTPLSDAAAQAYTAQGFEVGVHASTNCANYTASSIATTYSTQLAQWRANYPSLPAPVSNRLHCIAWSDWSSQASAERANGLRLDTNYYYWPASWVQNRPGFMTGSGMPMRFADPTGTMLDVYQAATQMTDESEQSYPFTPNTLLDNALGSTGYYGAFTANMHTDVATIPENDALILSAQARGVPIVSGKQLLTWVDGRNASSYGDVAWSANTLTFKVAVGAGANGLTGMVPTAGPNGTQLVSLSRGGGTVTTRTETIKGLEYAIFSAAAGSYTASYAAPGALTIAAVSPDAGPAATEQTTSLRWTTTNVATAEVSLGTSPTALTDKRVTREASRRHAVALKRLKPGTTYYYRVTSTDGTGASRTYPATGSAPATFVTPTADTTKPSATAPVVTALPDGSARVEWTTDEATTGVVTLGRSAKKLAPVAADAEAARRHTLVVTGLEPGATYWFATTSTDGAGNADTTKGLRVTTPAAGVAEQSAASFRRGETRGQATVDATEPGSITLTGKATTSRRGVFTSGVLDAQAMVDWDRMVTRGSEPTGSSLVIRVRTGSTATPDRTWSDWATVKRSGRVTGSSRFLQYEVVLTSAKGATAPELRAVGVSANGGAVTHEGETR